MDDELKAILNDLVQGQERLVQGQELLTQGQDELRSDVTSLRTDVTSLRTVTMTRFERIEDKLTSMSEDVSVNMMALAGTTTCVPPNGQTSINCSRSC